MSEDYLSMWADLGLDLMEDVGQLKTRVEAFVEQLR